MAKYYAPNFSGLLPLFDGKSAAGGKLYAYRAGSSIPAPLFDEDGVELGSWVSIDSNGCADFLLDSALSYKLIAKDALGAVVGEWDNVKATNAPGGMDNPMTAPGDLIVGGTGGTATALPVGAEGQALKVVSGSPAWTTDAEGMSNPMTTEGDLIVGGTDGEPSRLGVGSAGQVLTSDGTTWAPAAIPAQTGDHKTAVDGADASPDYLANKLAAGTGISLTNTGSAVEIAATTQSGDHQLLVSATDASAGYLGAKLTAGANVTLTPQTDGDGVQTLEISATGGGGGGGERMGWYWQPAFIGGFSNVGSNYVYVTELAGNMLPAAIKSFSVRPVDNPNITGFKMWVAIYEKDEATIPNSPLISSFTWDASKHPAANWAYRMSTFNYDAPINTNVNKTYYIVSYASNALSWYYTPTMSQAVGWSRRSWATPAASAAATLGAYTNTAVAYAIPWVALNPFTA